MSSRWLDIRKSVLWALVPGAVLPVVFFLLYSANSRTTGRDILPDLSNPFAVIGCFGFIATAFPGFIVFVLLFGGQQPVIAVTAFNSLPSQVQFVGQIVLYLAINTALWTLPVFIFRRVKRFFSASDNNKSGQMPN